MTSSCVTSHYFQITYFPVSLCILHERCAYNLTSKQLNGPPAMPMGDDGKVGEPYWSGSMISCVVISPEFEEPNISWTTIGCSTVLIHPGLIDFKKFGYDVRNALWTAQKSFGLQKSFEGITCWLALVFWCFFNSESQLWHGRSFPQELGIWNFQDFVPYCYEACGLWCVGRSNKSKIVSTQHKWNTRSQSRSQVAWDSFELWPWGVVVGDKAMPAML